MPKCFFLSYKTLALLMALLIGLCFANNFYQNELSRIPTTVSLNVTRIDNQCGSLSFTTKRLGYLTIIGYDNVNKNFVLMNNKLFIDDKTKPGAHELTIHLVGIDTIFVFITKEYCKHSIQSIFCNPSFLEKSQDELIMEVRDSILASELTLHHYGYSGVNLH